MKRKLILACSMLVLCSANLFAGPIDDETAFEKAKSFLAERGSTATLLKSEVRRVPVRNGSGVKLSPFYVFNADNGQGFVLVNGDSRGESILGYSNEGSLDINNLPPALQQMLDFYAEQICRLDEKAEKKDDSPRHTVSLTREPVAPFLTRQWSQSSPYNNLMPIHPNTGDHCPVGCVNVAMAEAIACFPGSISTIEAIPGYTSLNDYGTTQIECEDLEPFEVDWDLILDSYKVTSPQAAKTAIAKLMQCCAWSTHSSFGPTETGGMMADIPEALKTYFHFDDGAQSIKVTGAPDIEASMEVIYNEMRHHRPVIVGASGYANFTSSDNVGHAYVIGGYERDDFFYIDWGWGGYGQGWFRFSAMSLYDDPVYWNFSFSIYCIVGIQPAESTESNTIDYYLPEDKSLQFRHIKIQDNVVTVNNCNIYPTEETFEQALGAYDANFNLKAVIQKKENTYPAGVYTEIPVHPTDGANHPEVKNPETEVSYTVPMDKVQEGMLLLPVSRVKGTQTWHNDRCACDTAYFRVTDGNIEVVKTYEVISYGPHEDDTNQPAGAPADMILKVRNNSLDAQTLQMRLAADLADAGNAALTYSEALSILPHNSVTDLIFPFFEMSPGEYKTNLWIYRAAASGIGTSAQGKCNITFGKSKVYWAANGTSPITMEVLEQTPVTGTGNNGKTYTDKFYIKFRLKNTGDAAYNDFMRLLCISTSGRWYKTKLEHLRLQPGEEKEFDFYVDNLEFGTRARMVVAVKRQSGVVWDNKTTFDKSESLMNLVFTPTAKGIRYWDTEEHGNGVVDATAFETPDEALAVSTEGSTNTVAITPNDNPNTIYYVKNAEEAANLEGKNVVLVAEDGNAANSDIKLSDEYPAYIPEPFTLGNNEISYSRVFDKGNMGKKDQFQWSTMVLPFAPSSITADGTEQDWFHSKEESDKSIWIAYFYGQEAYKVFFKFPQELEAYKPYLITVASDHWGDEWNLVGKEIVFSKSGDSEYLVKATPREIFNEAQDLNFTATMSGTTPKESVYKHLYFLNEENGGYLFEYLEGSENHVEPFRAFFSSRSEPMDVTACVQIVILEDDVNSITTLTTHAAGNNMTIYNISGMKVTTATQDNLRNVLESLPKGIYIINGKKIIK